MFLGYFFLTLISLPSVLEAAEKRSISSSARSELKSALQPFIDKGELAGAVTLVAQGGEVLAVDAVGYSDLSAKTKMKADDLFWIASMTKPITAVTVLMLQDDGKLSVEDAVEKHLPEFKGQWMVQEKSNDKQVLVKAPRPVTIRDLMTHTSGLGEGPQPRAHSTLAELVMGYSQVPLQFPPGSKWSYCNPGINTLGRIVEVVSGKSFSEFLDQRLFKPLEMKDTTFWPSDSQARRLARSYQPSTNGTGLEESEVFILMGAPVTDRHRTPLPMGGLYSTARDMGRFYQMMLDQGVWQGKKLLSPEAVRQLTTTQTGDFKTGFVDGMSFGFGFAVVKEPRGITSMLSPGTFGHGGAFGTQSWADPQKDLILVMMIQRNKLSRADASPMREAFQKAALAAVGY